MSRCRTYIVSSRQLFVMWHFVDSPRLNLPHHVNYLVSVRFRHNSFTLRLLSQTLLLSFHFKHLEDNEKTIKTEKAQLRNHAGDCRYREVTQRIVATKRPHRETLYCKDGNGGRLYSVSCWGAEGNPVTIYSVCKENRSWNNKGFALRDTQDRVLMVSFTTQKEAIVSPFLCMLSNIVLMLSPTRRP